MKGLIITAGRGSRIGKLTEQTPKALLNINNKSFFENTIEHFHTLGVNNIATIVGYKKEQFRKIEGITFFENTCWFN